MENKNILVDKIVEICEGSLISRGTASTVDSFCVDTRELKKNDLFISLNIKDKDGIKYINEAFEKGAIGCITEYDIPVEIINNYKNKIIIKVKDSIKAIQDLAKYKRSLYNIPVVAVTGSVGKTSTKDMISNVLEEEFNVAKTQGNYNNHIGVPITILNWKQDTTAAVVEMGMNHAGEISVLTNIAKPTIAVITNVGTAHIGILGSRENILKAKLEILEGLAPTGKVIINNDNDLLNKCDTKKYEKITYGIINESTYTAYDIEKRETDSTYKIKINSEENSILVPVAGEHFIYNSLCAIAVARTLGMQTDKIIRGIKNVEITGKRNEIIEKNDIKILNDYYNASYDSMKASLEVLSKIQAKRKIAILGNMLELGKFSQELHEKVGEAVYINKVDILLTVGNLAKDVAKKAKQLGTNEIYSFDTNEQCIEQIKTIVKKGDAILLKASNMMNFKEISNFLQGEDLWKK